MKNNKLLLATLIGTTCFGTVWAHPGPGHDRGIRRATDIINLVNSAFILPAAVAAASVTPTYVEPAYMAPARIEPAYLSPAITYVEPTVTYAEPVYTPPPVVVVPPPPPPPPPCNYRPAPPPPGGPRGDCRGPEPRHRGPRR